MTTLGSRDVQVQLLSPRPTAPRPSVIPLSQRIIVTIDGPAGTGKSTVARELAKRLGLDFLDTGAMYRAATALAIDQNIDPSEHAALVSAVVDADLRFDWSSDPPSILAHFEPLDARIRRRDVTSSVSRVSAIPELRRHMVAKQRLIGQQHPRLVTEGRDQGSKVFPDAQVKIYLEARPEIRAQRRAAQLRAEGQRVDEAEILASLLDRDRQDSARTEGPLTCPVDAERVDTSDLTFSEVVERLESIVRAWAGVHPPVVRAPEAQP